VQTLTQLRERLRAAVDWYGPARALATAGSIVAVCVGAWWLLRAPAPPLENSLPFAGASSTSSIGTSTGSGALGNFTMSGLDITVHVVGAVLAPGVYTLRPGSRVVDAVEAAGGVASDADTASVNMALPLVDADQVFIPSRTSVHVTRTTVRPVTKHTNPTHPTVPQAIAAATTLVASTTGGSGRGIVNINTADATALETLPGIGPTTAKAIIAHRQANGPFGKVEALLDVKGIGEGKFAEMKPFVTVS
jgi:competence protein ComEA